MPRPPKKKTRVLAEAQRTGELIAERKFRSKTFKNKSQIKAWLYERLEKLVDKIDPMKAVAVFGLTFLIKSTIDWAQIAITPAKLNIVYLLLTADWTTAIKEIAEEATVPTTPESAGIKAEIIEWLISFVVAYIVIENARAIIEAGGNLLFVAKGLVGGLIG